MTKINGNRVQTLKETIGQDGQVKKMFSILEMTEKGLNTIYLTSKEETIIQKLSSLVGKCITAKGTKNGNFLSLNNESGLNVVNDESKEFEEVEEFLENVKLLKVIPGTSKDFNTKEEKKTITLSFLTSNNTGINVSVKDADKINPTIFNQVLGKKMTLRYVNIFKNKEGKTFYSISNDMKKSISLS